MRRGWIAALALLALWPLQSGAQQQPAESTTLAAPQGLLPARLEPPPCPCEKDLIAAQGFPADQVGYILFDLATGTIVSSFNPDRLFIPASVQKLPTMVAGLAVLGPEYRFETEVLASVPIKSGTLAGDLYLKGGGDPFLTTDDVQNFVLALKDQGLAEVEGGFFFDESALPKLQAINPLQPVAVPYNPGVSALTVNFNIVQLNWHREPGTGEIVGSALSRSDTLDVVAEAITFAPQEQAVSKTMPVLLDRTTMTTTGSERWLLSPSLPKKGKLRLPVKQAGMNVATIFRSLAAEEGIVLAAPQAGSVPEAAVLLRRHESVALDKAAKLILRYSNNLSAELVGLSTAQHLGAATGSLQQSSLALSGWLRREIPWADWTGFVADNHSGLSTASRMSARQAMAILSYAWGLRLQGLDVYALMPKVRWNDELNDEYEASLEEAASGAGAAATEGEPSGLEVRAKSGTVYWSRGLAGYIQSSQGRMLGFALFVGDLDTRAAYDAQLNIDELAAAPGAGPWMKRAKALEQALVTRWATGY